MSEISKLPWAVNEVHGVSDRIEDANGRIILAFNEWNMDDVYHIVKCVNEYEQLQAENERLKQENEKLSVSLNFLSDEYERRLELKEENYKLKQAVSEREEALRKCSPWDSYVSGHDECIFCEGTGHTGDCDYVRLTGGAE
jgi:hypothetical protein